MRNPEKLNLHKEKFFRTKGGECEANIFHKLRNHKKKKKKKFPMAVRDTDGLVCNNEVVVKADISQKGQHFESVTSHTYVFT